jgi:predicted nuclease of restriction endonuclease-like RecB superfamily
VLTADLVRARRRGDELVLVGLDGAGRARAEAIAAQVIEAVKACVGGTREELDLALEAIDVEPRDERVKAGLAKLAGDRCTFGAKESFDPAATRRELFLRASAARKEGAFDRASLLAAFAGERGLDPEAIERGLYADLRGAHVLQEMEPIAPQALATLWEHGQAQAVLLRAVRVTVDVRCASPGAARALFHRLKFLQLLHTITPIGRRAGSTPALTPSESFEGGHRIVIDGPFSLFESVTKYGLKLAMVLPVLEGCASWSLVADVRWGKERTPLVFRLDGGSPEKKAGARRLPDDVAALKEAFARLDSGWEVAPSAAILDLPGIGLCVPDLTFTRGGATVHLEVMGYWSRDAVWKRVELVQAGLEAPVLFAVSARLRVSEEVLGDDVPGALYVYKGTMSARAVAERLEGLAQRAEKVPRA